MIPEINYGNSIDKTFWAFINSKTVATGCKYSKFETITQEISHEIVILS